MNEYEEMRKEIDIYLMKRFKYRLSLVNKITSFVSYLNNVNRRQTAL